MTSAFGPGKKNDEDKQRTDLLPVGALLEVAKVLTHGASKYSANNWQNVRPVSRYWGALLRHGFARVRGEIVDPETGIKHTAHMACNALFLCSFDVGHDNPGTWEPEEEMKDAYCPKCDHDMCQCPKDEPPWPPVEDQLVWICHGTNIGKRATVIEVDEEGEGFYHVRLSSGERRFYCRSELSPAPITVAT
jgi:hypothetical protein